MVYSRDSLDVGQIEACLQVGEDLALMQQKFLFLEASATTRSTWVPSEDRAIVLASSVRPAAAWFAQRGGSIVVLH